MNRLSDSKAFIASHRAALGIAALVAAIANLALPDPAGAPWEKAALIAAGAVATITFLVGICAVILSPYVPILYREALLRRLTGQPSELDEWELGLRERANSLAYPVFLAVNLVACFGLGIAFESGWFGVDRSLVVSAVFAYGFVGLGLPVILLEWVEPSVCHDAPEDR